MGAEPSYFSALWTTISSPLSTAESLATPAGGSGAAVPLSAANVLNYQSQSQKNSLISQESSELQQAGMSADDAQTEATADVTSSLVSSGTDPSQNPLNNLPGLPSLSQYAPYLIAGGVTLAGVAMLGIPSLSTYGLLLIAGGVIALVVIYEMGSGSSST
jgi:hypothetical protein